MRHIQIRVSDAEYAEFVARADAAGLSYQEAGRQALVAASWDKPEGLEAKVPPKLRPYLKRLVEVFASGNASVIDAVTRNIDVFLAHVRALRSLRARL